MNGGAPRLLFLVTEDWYFCSHRLGLARAAREAGFEVGVATRVGAHGALIEEAGIELHPMPWRRGSTGARSLAADVLRIRALYRRLRPHIVHHVALKPVVLGTLAARLAGTPAIVNAVTGLGFTFSSSDPKARLLRPLVRHTLRAVASGRRTLTVVQNRDDLAFVHGLGVPEANLRLIRGAGVDPARFEGVAAHRRSLQAGTGAVKAALVGRMLEDKGVRELVEAARILRRRGAPVHIRLVGAPDEENPASIGVEELRQWTREGLVAWHGPVEDVRAVWQEAEIAVLPSWREGLPRALLEAGASARALVATDVPGCREVVIPGVSGMLVPPGSPEALAGALETLARDGELRRRLGEGARELVCRELSEERVIGETIAVYRELLAGPDGERGRKQP